MIRTVGRAACAIMLLAAVPAVAGDLPIIPDPMLTPGAVLTTDAAAVCQPGYAKTVRHPRRTPKLLALGPRPLQARLDSLLDH